MSDFPDQINRIYAANDLITKHAQETQERQARNSGRYDAEDLFAYLLDKVKRFQRTLDHQHEVGVKLANFGIAAEIHIRAISYRNPNLIEFSGVLSDGKGFH